MKRYLAHILTPLLCLLATAGLRAQPTAFTYQGRLTEGAQPATGLYDLTFKLYDNAGPGVSGQQGSTVGKTAVPVTNGLFIVSLDFGSTPFNGAQRWVQIDARTNNPALSYVTLLPRTELTPTPYAIRARTAGSVADGGVSATALAASPAANQILSFNGSSLQWINAPSGTFSLPYRGAGTASPIFALTNTAAGVAIRGESLGGGGRGMFGKGDYGVWGESSTGYGVHGQSTSVPGGRGVSGTGDYGVWGGSTTGYGVYGQSTALNGRGVYGLGDYGVYGLTDSPGGRGVTGLANSSALDSVGVIGRHTPTSNQGSLGTENYGVYGRAGNSGSYGVAGEGDNIGVYAHNPTSGKTAYLATPTLAGDFYGDIYVHGAITISGGADLAEPFKISSKDIPKGALVIIDEDHPGHLMLSNHDYDTRVAGIVSGANGIKPGISLHQEGAVEGTGNVALSGRVYALADASKGPIKPGDLLTTSATPGHCMKVSDTARAQGAIIGKAMTGLKEGKGMVLVLVSLQ